MGHIKIDNVSKDYGQGRGIFNISFEVKKGEVFGYLGPNGAGKTTTIRTLLGFIKPNSGQITIDDVDTWKDHHLTNASIGYLPGEINFPSSMNGYEVLKWNAELKNVKNLSLQNELIEYFELKNLHTKVKRMSKGMKQKLGIICAFMHDPDTLILDEPTSGLDPLMQDRFVRLIKKEKTKGKTILMSSHMFSEIEKTCDRVAIIRSGSIVSIFDLKEIFDGVEETFEITFKDEKSANKYAKNKDNVIIEGNIVRATIIRNKVNDFLKEINKYEVIKFIEIKKTLEEVFMSYYSSKNKGDDHYAI